MARGRRPTAASLKSTTSRPPRGRRAASSDGRLAEIVRQTVNDLVDAVREEVRRSVADEVNGLLMGGKVLAGRRGRGALGGRKRVMPCIAPGCNNQSKGPRFHYLCEKHKDAKKQDYEAWRKARKEKQAA